MSRIKNARKFRKEFEANKRVIQRFILLQDIPGEELSDLIDAFPRWEDYEGMNIPKDEVVQDEDMLWKCIQAHNWQADWKPKLAVSLFVKYNVKETENGEEVVAPWEQRYGHNPYVKNDKVLWTDGKVYKCIAETTTYSPKSYAQHWELVA